MSKQVLNLNETRTAKKVNELTSSLVLYSKTQNERISQKTANITVQVLLLNPRYSNILNESISKTEKIFIKDCYEFLFNEKSITSLTFRMQCFFYGRFLNRDAYKNHQKQVLMRNCFNLLEKLKKVWHNPSEDLKEMHNDLVKLILIKEGMDFKDDPSAFEEMKAALNSVFPTSSLSTFVSSSQKTKMAFINEVSSIAAGIRLHAWYSQKAGKFMFDAGTIMKETLPKVCEDLHEEFNCIKEKVERLRNELLCVTEETPSTKETHHNKLMLIALTNYMDIIKYLKESIDEVAVQTYKLDYSFAVQIKELSSNMKVGPFTKADLIYPHYKNLAKTWKQIQLEGHLLSFYTNLFYDVKKFSESLSTVKPIDEIPIKGNCSFEDDGNCTVILPKDVKNFNAITLQYKGFCAFYCSLGILVQSNKEHGIIMYNYLCYGFSSIETLKAFKNNPNKYIKGSMDLMLKIPQLIFTLHTEENFGITVLNAYESEQISPVFVANTSIQTVLHPIEKNIDNTYNWNQWTLRKQALKYVDLLDKRTHSTQTDLSHFRRENYSQVYLPRDSSTQTRKDASTSVTKAELSKLSLGTTTEILS
ncbi:hypothetical protein JTE90_011591 [Oedothorax gibbosus]|uniref:Cilia- and flagella-associated protein 206 n=1 Tax=Oedothorax gibbosus TaxID=931172 RepID=A0AAV6U5L3_9ARAC|nr:hypothetical protein JTE90_011591 [Oedothorax gibbosus]